MSQCTEHVRLSECVCYIDCPGLSASLQKAFTLLGLGQRQNNFESALLVDLGKLQDVLLMAILVVS